MAGITKHYVLNVGGTLYLDKKIVPTLRTVIAQQLASTRSRAIGEAIPKHVSWRKVMGYLWENYKANQPSSSATLTEYKVRKGRGFTDSSCEFKSIATGYRSFLIPKKKMTDADIPNSNNFPLPPSANWPIGREPITRLVTSRPNINPPLFTRPPNAEQRRRRARDIQRQIDERRANSAMPQPIIMSNPTMGGSWMNTSVAQAGAQMANAQRNIDIFESGLPRMSWTTDMETAAQSSWDDTALEEII